MADLAHARRTARALRRGCWRANGTTTALVFGAHFPHAQNAALRGGRRTRPADRERPRRLRPQPAPDLEVTPDVAYATSQRAAATAGTATAGCATRSRRASASPAPSRCSTPAARCSTSARRAVHQPRQRDARRDRLRQASSSRQARDYLDTYEHAGLLRDRSVLAHNVHVSDDELQRLATQPTPRSRTARPATRSWPPGSSRWRATSQHGVRFGMGTDVGAGTGLSMLKEGLVAYHVQMVRDQGHMLGPAHLLYLATAAGADALGLQRHLRRPDARASRPTSCCCERPHGSHAGGGARGRAGLGAPRSARSSRSPARSACVEARVAGDVVFYTQDEVVAVDGFLGRARQHLAHRGGLQPHHPPQLGRGVVRDPLADGVAVDAARRPRRPPRRHPSTATIPTGSSDVPPSRSARAAPASTTTTPSDGFA